MLQIPFWYLLQAHAACSSMQASILHRLWHQATMTMYTPSSRGAVLAPLRYPVRRLHIHVQSGSNDLRTRCRHWNRRAAAASRTGQAMWQKDHVGVCAIHPVHLPYIIAILHEPVSHERAQHCFALQGCESWESICAC